MDICKKVGRNVKKYRLENGWSQEELALECELHRTYISGVERGIRNPTVRVVDIISKALDIPPSKLFE